MVLMQKELQAAYIGEALPFYPGANTLLYMPFKEDMLDHSGNSNNPTDSYNTSITTLDGILCCFLNTGKFQFSQFATMSAIDFTVLVRVKFNSQSKPHSFISTGSAGTDRLLNFRTNDGTTGLNFGRYGDDLSITQTLSTSSWQLVTATYNHTSKYGIVYYNGTSKGTRTYSNPNVTANPIYVGVNAEVPNNAQYMFYGYMSEYILENKVWTAQEISDYYDASKGKYGL